MTPQQIVGLFVRLFSVWLFIYAFQVNGYIHAFNSQLGADPISGQYLIVGLVVSVALLLWFFPMAVAHKLIPKTQYQNKLNLPLGETVHVACIVFGLWILLVKVLPSIAYYIPLAIVASRDKFSTNDYNQFTFMKIAPIVIEFATAMVLIFKSQAISRFLIMAGIENLDAEDN